jgi:hypothetical protein
MNMPIARLSVDPEIMSIVGRKLYSGNPLPIIVRELLQNARDACAKAEVAPEIQMDLFFDRKAWDGPEKLQFIVCRDNGTGMTAEEIVSKFLCLGGSTKRTEGGNRGGFGIAKAAFLCAQEWGVRSLEWAVNRRDMEQELPVRECVSKYPGTMVAVGLRDLWRNQDMEDAFLILAFSDVPVHVRLHMREAGGKMSLTFDGMLGGAGMGEGWQMLSVMDGKPGLVLRGNTKVEIPIVRHGENVYFENVGQGRIIVRLVDLMQFEIQRYSKDKRKTTLIVDVTNPPPVNDPAYPFNLSREELTYEIRNKVSDLIRPHTVNPLTSYCALTEKKTSVQVLNGCLMQGCMDPADDELDAGFQSATSVAGMEEQPVRSEMVRVLLDGVQETNLRQVDWQLLETWKQILIRLTYRHEEFGLGFLAEGASAKAERRTHEGSTFYLIRRREIDSKANPVANVLCLWSLACHEVAHRKYSDHDEFFTSYEAKLAKLSAPAMAMDIKQIARCLHRRVNMKVFERAN